MSHHTNGFHGFATSANTLGWAKWARWATGRLCLSCLSVCLGSEKGIHQQIQPMPAKPEHCDLLCSMELASAKLLSRVNFKIKWFALLIETPKAKKKTRKTEFMVSILGSCWGSKTRCSYKWSWLSASSVCHPFTQTGSQTVPQSSQTYTQDAVGFWSWNETSQSLSNAISHCTADSYPF